MITLQPLHLNRLRILPASVLVVIILIALSYLKKREYTVYAKVSSSTGSNKYTIESIQDQIISKKQYRYYPKRHRDEAAVIEWGNSAIISAIDASVAYFGPQTSDAAIFEVETTPILAEPINGMHMVDENSSPYMVSTLSNAKDVHGNVAVMTDTGTYSVSVEDGADVSEGEQIVISCLDLAIIAQNSRAAALIIVHVNEDRPDDAPRCAVPKGREKEAMQIDIPIVTISLASSDVFTSATVKEDTKPEDIVNHGMPDRIRLYASNDRPFFEDIEGLEPTVYMIHNLLTIDECNTIMDQAHQQQLEPIRPSVGNSNSYPLLEYMTDSTSYINVNRTVLYTSTSTGVFQSLGMKAIEDRIEQVTGFPPTHYSDWIVERLLVDNANDNMNSMILPHHDDSLLSDKNNINSIPHATITVFLNDYNVVKSDDDTEISDGFYMVYPSIGQSRQKKKILNQHDKNHIIDTNPIVIRPTQGLAVVHHNPMNNNYQGKENEDIVLELDPHTIHSIFPLKTSTNGKDDTDRFKQQSQQYLYIARKYVLPQPISKIRRSVLPLYVMLLGIGLGRSSPTSYSTMLYQYYNPIFVNCIQTFGVENGNLYFDYILVGIPAIIVVIILSIIGYFIYQYIRKQQSTIIYTTSSNDTIATPKKLKKASSSTPKAQSTAHKKKKN